VLNTLEELANQLTQANNGGPVVGVVPEALVPADQAAIFALQDMIIAQSGAVGGWKMLVNGDAAPSCAPLPQIRYFPHGCALSAPQHKIIIAEVEIAVAVGKDIPADADAATVEASIASVHPALEMVANHFEDRDATPANVKTAALQSNGAIVVGPAFDDAVKAQLDTLPVSLELDGVEVKSAASGASWASIVTAMTFLAKHAAERGYPLKAGQVIITGARVLEQVGAATAVVGRMGDKTVISANLDH
jgi:2-keto-4-pentenoate hydratase